MKTKYNNRRYKLQRGVQQIQMDTPDYSSAYKIREEQNAKGQIGQNIGATAANIAMPGLGSAMQGVGAISDAVFKDAKGNYKNKFSEVLGSQLNPLDKAGKAFSALTGDKTAAADLFSSSLIGTGLGALGVKNPFGKTTQEKVKKTEREAEVANFNKTVKEGTSTDAQSFLAKRGKYKVKSKQPRLIETEGREPIFSPKKKDGSRDLLYYNPNDPTHEEGGVKAMVVPKAQAGKKKIKVKEEPQYLEDNDSIVEEIGEIFDPTGISSYDDVYRSFVNLKNNKDRNLGDYVDLGLETLGAVPVIGKAGKLAKLGKYAFKYADKGLEARKIIQRANKIKDAGNAVRTSKVVKKSLPQTVKSVIKGARIGDRISDYNTISGLAKEFKGYENPEWERTHSLENAKFMGRKIFPKVSNENMYFNGTSKIMSGRKHSEIPEIKPPTPYELMPKPPRSRFNKDSKKVKVYR